VTPSTHQHLGPVPRTGLYWTDGAFVARLTDHEIALWKERGVSRGHVVTARDHAEALAIGKKLATALDNGTKRA
jgi:hypothetical protein